MCKEMFIVCTGVIKINTFFKYFFKKLKGKKYT